MSINKPKLYLKVINTGFERAPIKTLILRMQDMYSSHKDKIIDMFPFPELRDIFTNVADIFPIKEPTDMCPHEIEKDLNLKTTIKVLSKMGHINILKQLLIGDIEYVDQKDAPLGKAY